MWPAINGSGGLCLSLFCGQAPYVRFSLPFFYGNRALFFCAAFWADKFLTSETLLSGLTLQEYSISYMIVRCQVKIEKSLVFKGFLPRFSAAVRIKPPAPALSQPSEKILKKTREKPRRPGGTKSRLHIRFIREGCMQFDDRPYTIIKYILHRRWKSLKQHLFLWYNNFSKMCGKPRFSQNIPTVFHLFH